TIYNRMYSRYYRMDSWDSDKSTNKITAEEFKVWTDMASKARHEYKAGRISGDELLERIGQYKNPSKDVTKTRAGSTH
ncbi:MAG: hypothetical protein GX811_11950, partial [Lentisphaerae bacterium]|nr:hypothetical protein [Lentisphaerota bacterium]